MAERAAGGLGRSSGIPDKSRSSLTDLAVDLASPLCVRHDGADLGPRDVGVAANLAKLAGGQTGGALVESVTAPLTMTQHGWDKLYAEYKESGE